MSSTLAFTSHPQPAEAGEPAILASHPSRQHASHPDPATASHPSSIYNQPTQLPLRPHSLLSDFPPTGRGPAECQRLLNRSTFIKISKIAFLQLRLAAALLPQAACLWLNCLWLNICTYCAVQNRPWKKVYEVQSRFAQGGCISQHWARAYHNDFSEWKKQPLLVPPAELEKLE